MSRIVAMGMLAVIGAGAAAWAGPECCPEKAAAARKAAVEKADQALARLQAVPEQMKAMPEEARAALARGQAVMAKSCPICPAMPEVMGFIGESLAAGAALDGKICEGGACGGEAAAAAKTRAALGAKSSALFGALCSAMKSGADGDCEAACRKDAAKGAACEKDGAAATKGDCESAGGCPLARFDGLLMRADEVSARWQAAADKWGALAGAEKDELTKALGEMKKASPACAAWADGLRALKGLLQATVAQDAACEKACAAKEGDAARAAAVCAPYLKRAELTKRVLELVTRVAAVTAPSDACCEKEKKAAVTQ